MNYMKIYNQIIDRARSEIRDGYLEKHHIIPKCMGGNNTKDNLVQLTAREHFICHWLLAKHYNIKALWAAAAMMKVGSGKHDRGIRSGRLYEIAKKRLSLHRSGEGNHMYGKTGAFKDKKHSDEAIEKIRQSKLGKKRAPFKRRSPSPETIEKQRISHMGGVPWNKGKKMDKVKCPHCEVIGGGSNMTRWHFDKCKHKPTIHQN